MESKKKVKKSRLIYINIVVVLLLLQVIAWNSRSFSDAYIAYIFPIWVNTCGRITGSFPFSVGEWMIVAGITVVISAVLLGISMIFPGCRYSAKYCRGVKRYFRFFAWVLLFVFTIMTLNCTMIYHGSTFSEKYFGEEEKQDVTLQERTEELLRIYNDIVSHCNALSMEMDRDEPLETVVAFAKRTGVTYPLALDPGADIFARYADRKAGITRNVLIDKAGKIVMLTRLYNEEEFSSLCKKIDEMLGEK